MTHARLVERHDPSTYALGIRLLELGNIVKSRINIREVALPFMQKLHDTIDESINLGIRDQDEIIYIERTSSGRSLVRVVYLVGGRAPLHLTSLGKLFLAAECCRGSCLCQAHRAAGKDAAFADQPGRAGKRTRQNASIRPGLRQRRGRDRPTLPGLPDSRRAGIDCRRTLPISAPTDRHDPSWEAQVKSAADAISTALGYRPPRQK